MENNTRKEPEFSSLIKHPAITELSLLLQRIKYDTEYIKVPEKGWIYTIRTVCNMPLRIIADKITRETKSGERKTISPEAIKQYEESEAKIDKDGKPKESTISISTLEKVAKAMDMKLVYFFVPINEEESLDEEVKRRIKILIENKHYINTNVNDYLKDIPKEIWTIKP